MNNLTITGRLTRDVTFTTKTGTAKARAFFTIASQRPRTDGGADFIAMTAFGRTAEVMNEHLGKGNLIAVTGHLHSSSYETAGETHYAQEAIASQVDFLARAAETA